MASVFLGIDGALLTIVNIPPDRRRTMTHRHDDR